VPVGEGFDACEHFEACQHVCGRTSCGKLGKVTVACCIQEASIKGGPAFGKPQGRRQGKLCTLRDCAGELRAILGNVCVCLFGILVDFVQEKWPSKDLYVQSHACRFVRLAILLCNTFVRFGTKLAASIYLREA
jgi:hypothetical protein